MAEAEDTLCTLPLASSTCSTLWSMSGSAHAPALPSSTHQISATPSDLCFRNTPHFCLWDFAFVVPLAQSSPFYTSALYVFICYQESFISDTHQNLMAASKSSWPLCPTVLILTVVL